MTVSKLRATTARFGLTAGSPCEFWLGDPGEGGVRLEVASTEVVHPPPDEGGKPTGVPRLVVSFRPTDAAPPDRLQAQTLPTQPVAELAAAVDVIPGESELGGVQ